MYQTAGLPRRVAFHGCQTGTLKPDIESGEYPELDPFKDSAALGGAAYRTTARAIERAAQLVSRWWVGEPGAELAQVVLNVRHRRRPETQCDLIDVAARRLGEAGRDDRPAAHRDRRSIPWPSAGVRRPLFSSGMCHSVLVLPKGPEQSPSR